MILETYKSLWGMTGALEANVRRIAEAGYDGVECAPQELSSLSELKRLLEAYRLKCIALVYTEDDHIAELRKFVLQATELAPEKIVVHGGRDLMPHATQVRFFGSALNLEDEARVRLAHETHRRRPLFTPMNTLAILKELPELGLNIDLSHWCCVTESLLQDHSDAITIAAAHAEHLHGRVGYENGPQVPDPRVPEWERCVSAHERWWTEILQCSKRRGIERFTFTPEYGPPSYMQTIPQTGAPASDLWDVCLWANDRFKQLFANVIG